MLQFNRYVRSGYRAGMSPRQCLCSMFQYHNETGARCRVTATGAAYTANLNLGEASRPLVLYCRRAQCTMPVSGPVQHRDSALRKLTGRHLYSSLTPMYAPAGNIWIHLLPLLAIVGGIATSWLPVWPGRPWEFFQNIAPIAICYLGSVTYHTMMAYHQKYKTWITLDVSNPLTIP